MSNQFEISRDFEEEVKPDESSATPIVCPIDENDNYSLAIVVAVLATLFVISLIVNVVCVIFIFILLSKRKNSAR